MEVHDAQDQKARLSVYMTYFLSILGGIGIGLNSFSTAIFTTTLALSNHIGEAETSFWVGIVATGFGVTYVVSPVLLGLISDKIGRRWALVIAMLGFAATNAFIIAFAVHPIHLVIANALTGFFYGFYWSPIEAYLSEMTESISKKLHAKSLSIYLVCWSIGLTIGPFIGGIFDAQGSILTGFFTLMVIAACVAIISYKFIFTKQEIAAFTKITRPIPAVAADPSYFTSATRDHLIYVKIGISFSAIYFAFTNQILQRIFPAFAIVHMDSGVLFASISKALTASILIFCLGIARTITLWHSGVISSKAREQMLLIVALGIPIANLFIYLFPVADALLVSFIVFGLFNGYAYCVGVILLMELSKTGKGLKAGIYEAAIGLGFLVSTFTSSFLSPVDPRAPFLLGTLVSTSLTIVLILVKLWSTRSNEKMQ